MELDLRAAWCAYLHQHQSSPPASPPVVSTARRKVLPAQHEEAGDALVQERLAQLQREAEDEVAAQQRDEQAVLARRRGVERARWELDRAAEERDATRSYVASGRHDELAALRATDERRSQREAIEAAEAARAAEAEAAAVEPRRRRRRRAESHAAAAQRQLQQHVRSQAAGEAAGGARSGGWGTEPRPSSPALPARRGPAAVLVPSTAAVPPAVADAASTAASASTSTPPPPPPPPRDRLRLRLRFRRLRRHRRLHLCRLHRRPTAVAASTVVSLMASPPSPSGPVAAAVPPPPPPPAPGAYRRCMPGYSREYEVPAARWRRRGPRSLALT